VQLGPKPIRLRWDPKSTYSASNSPVDMTQPDPDISGVGIQPLLAAELIFWLLIFFVTWHVVLKARRTSWQSTRMNTPVGVDQKTKVEKNVQLISGPYEAWVPDFVVRSFSSSIRKIRITQETSLLWQPSTVEINDAQPESTLRRRHKKYVYSFHARSRYMWHVSDDNLGATTAPQRLRASRPRYPMTEILMPLAMSPTLSCGFLSIDLKIPGLMTGTSKSSCPQ
jgi:hypothetical protein